MNTPADKTITLTFYSHPMKSVKMRWKALMTFRPGLQSAAAVEIAMADGEGESVESGVFEFAGRRIRIKDGKGHIKYGDFVKGKHETAIWLYRKGMCPVPGALTFE